mgnify:CR=1 FL=1
MKSDAAKKGIERAPHRSLFKAMGYTDLEIQRPLIGIANSYNNIIPGHVHLDKIVEAVKAGIYAAGGTPIAESVELELELVEYVVVKTAKTMKRDLRRAGKKGFSQKTLSRIMRKRGLDIVIRGVRERAGSLSRAW